ncbi:ABC transporter ATP-binding protein [Desulforhopalus sp. IMCC35007]|uniref:ABC transporter ATP-binding protein n=1 Tax=Desulforhopalus sp. IMCC35007 TaxID=2569543 RepID=UPI0010AE8A3C|nr:ABC transporter ATP-binding protein [Desulforhopalus sp. IMCC35007]TKB10783.1 ABC transporter ATP-binding protein [Desulforhopalus sp. IMCC35007]
MPVVLDIVDLTKRFADFVAVDNVCFQAEEGKFFSILGPSGCGKTTLLRMIAGFLEPTSGSLQIRGKDMLGIPPNRRPVNLVFQNLALFPMMNVADNIGFGLKRQRCPKKEIASKTEAMLERVHLSGYGSKDISQLSGGQKQRVAIARALVLEPSILLLDEPLGALDLKLREQMKIELKNLQREVGTTFIYITHDQSEALVMSDTVAVMNAGRFEQIDTPRNLYSRPASSFVAGFVGETNIFAASVEDISPTLRLRAENGVLFKATAMQEMAGAKKGRLFIRPEAIILEPDSGLDNLNRFEVTVRTILFDGSNTKILAMLGDREITVALPQNQQFAHITPGETVSAGVHIDACKCYPGE